MSNTQDDGGMQQSDEFAAAEPQALEPVQVNVPVERSAPVPPPAEEPDAAEAAAEVPAEAQVEVEMAAPVEIEMEVSLAGEVVHPTDVLLRAGDKLSISPAESAKEEQALADVQVTITADAAPIAEVLIPEEAPSAPAIPQIDNGAEMAEEDTASFHFPPPEPVNNATQERPCGSPLPKDWKDPTAVWLPADTTERMTDYLSRQPRTDLADTDAGAEWMGGLAEGAEHGFHRDFGAAMAQRPDANWRQRIQFGEKKMEIAAPKLGDDGPLLSGERGLLRMNALLGRGSIVQVPLWHSGFWITFKLPGEDQLTELEERIANDKILLGRMTHGLVFSNTSVYIASALVDLCMDSIYETTIEDVKTMKDVRDLIQEPDLHALAWGLASVIYSRGFQYLRSMLDENGQRTDVIREKLNVATLLWVDDNALTDWQRSHMSNRRSSSMAVKNIKMYQDAFTKGKPKSVKIADNLAMTFKTPSLQDSLAQGFNWVDDVARSISRALTDEATLERRNALMMMQGRATSMRQYVHWVESIELPDTGQQIVDRATITAAFNSLSADDNIRNSFYDAVKDYIAENTIAMIATPLISEKEKEFTKPRFPWLLPIDPVSVFSTLLSQKAQQISTRP